MTEDAYVTTSWWYPQRDEWETERGLPGYEPDPSVHEHPDLDSAERQGGQYGCINGIRRVEVRSPDGELQALWDKESRLVTKTRRYPDLRGRMTYDVEHRNNTWQRLGEESKELGRCRSAEINDAYWALRAEHGRTPSSTQVVERMRRDRAAADAGSTSDLAPDTSIP